MREAAKRGLRRQFQRTLVRRQDGTSIWHWPAMPPECPVESYSVSTTDPSIYGTFPTLKQAVEWADRSRCPFLVALPFSQED